VFVLDPGLHSLKEFLPGIRVIRAPAQFELQFVIEGEKKTLCYFHRCEKAVESILVRVFFRLRNSIRAGTVVFLPLSPRAARPELSAHVPPL